mmetsp:Transcript_45505/g.89519  ORF Transcript_45505/g.89519 Transcript_45505/m.89519 type:complete len:846 (-) Transcript_45505:143-2680(-)
MAKKCLYEILGVERSAATTEIKQAYRKLALKWHPDKNADNVEEATERFKEIQEAWEILKNEQERAWYDGHRTQILSGGMDDDEEDDGDELNLHKYMNSKAFSGFSDSGKGFFKVFADLFAEIDKLEGTAVNDSNAKVSKDIKRPGFGLSSSEAELVEAFYSYWSNFVSVRSFAHRDKWNLKDAPSRQVKRLMEADNKKIRFAAKKKFNTLVQSLAKWVRGQDKRWMHLKLEKAKESERKEAAEQKRQQEIKAKKKADREAFRAEEAARLAEQAKAMKAAYGKDFEESEEEDKDIETFECVVCDKLFKSEKQFHNHEKSKKHKQEITRLQLENRKLFGGKNKKPPAKQVQEEDTSGSDSDTGSSSGGGGGADAPTSSRKQKGQMQKGQKGRKPAQESEEDESDSASSSESPAEKRKGKRSVAIKKRGGTSESGSDNSEEVEAPPSGKRKANATQKQNPKQKRKQKQRQEQDSSEEEEEEEEGEEDLAATFTRAASLSKKQRKKQNKRQQRGKASPTAKATHDNDSSDQEQTALSKDPNDPFLPENFKKLNKTQKRKLLRQKEKETEIKKEKEGAKSFVPVTDIKTRDALNKALAEAGSDKVVCLDFTASWCGPCQSIRPFFFDLAKRTPALGFYKVDVDKNKQVATLFKITSIPTFLFLQNKKEVARLTGADKSKLNTTVSKFAKQPRDQEPVSTSRSKLSKQQQRAESDSEELSESQNSASDEAEGDQDDDTNDTNDKDDVEDSCVEADPADKDQKESEGEEVGAKTEEQAVEEKKEETETPPATLSKREKRRAKKAKQAAAAAAVPASTQESATEWRCNVCSNLFDTRNKLFTHIKKTGHALRV